MYQSIIFLKFAISLILPALVHAQFAFTITIMHLFFEINKITKIYTQYLTITRCFSFDGLFNNYILLFMFYIFILSLYVYVFSIFCLFIIFSHNL